MVNEKMVMEGKKAMKFKNMKKVIAVGMFASLVIGVVPAMPASAEGSLL